MNNNDVIEGFEIAPLVAVAGNRGAIEFDAEGDDQYIFMSLTTIYGETSEEISLIGLTPDMKL